MLTNPLRKALCWHFWKEVENAEFDGHYLIKCVWCYHYVKGESLVLDVLYRRINEVGKTCTLTR